MEDIQDKHLFLNWIILNHPHPNREIMIFLAYLQMKPSELQWIEFSHDVIYAPRGIKIAYPPLQDQALVYYKEDYIYHRIDQAFHDFRLNSLKKDQPFYLEFDIADYQLEAMQRGVLKENPFVPIQMKDLDQVNQSLDQISRQAYKRIIMNKINDALEKNNYDKIDRWIDQYRSGLE
ncbi:YpiB family protein [Facklamia sp. 7083-14-GEN3]|uniref:YpiB family protein n=1 Tax=Facklamia sp. 7083-14-GEN3 TaxID=2973478 RepID=UPI00215C0C5C|nr:YpiB family protein [Facklamia sp. 7083-14-GEN3]MCR8968964.1 YpiB family protein [Facklamia sp. 7083-14-GEN3]